MALQYPAEKEPCFEKERKMIMKGSLYRAAAASLAAVIAAVSVSGCYLLPDEEELLAPPVIKASEVKYSTVTVEKKDLEKKLVSSGTVTAEKQYPLFYEKQGGTVSKFYIHAGDSVKAGDPICELDTSDVDYQITEKELYKKKAELAVAIIRQRDGTQAEIDRAGVDVELLQNELDKLYEKKELAVLKSPIDGTISSIADVRVGDSVGTGSTIATVIDTSGFYIAVQPSDMSAFPMDTEVIVKIGSNEYKGVVFMTPYELQRVRDEKIDDHEKEDTTGINFNSDNIYVRFAEEVPPETVGQVADVILVQESVKDAVVISNNLIKTVDGQKIVYVLRDGEKTAVPVQIGLKTGSQSEITSGLSEGDEIVIR